MHVHPGIIGFRQRSPIRRVGLLCGLIGITCWPAPYLWDGQGGHPPATCRSVAHAAETRSPVKPRRILFNCDGCSVRIDNNDAHDLNIWINNLFTGLEGSPVTTLLWCDGSGGNTALYDSKVLELDGARIGKPDPWVSKWIKEGNDPPSVVIREARKRGLDVFYSFRINDIHDAFTPNELPTFKVQHPEWQIGDKQPYGYPTALNFAVPEVRELKRRTIDEIATKYDFDGLEIDFLRGPPFFMPGKEPDNAGILTDFLRTVCRMLDDRAKQRGRRFELAARVDETLDACRLDGFDVAAWVNEGLIDILIMGSGTIEVDVPAFKKLVAGTPVRIYPCIYGWPSKYMPIPAALARGIAATFWRDNADGIYLFNWFPHQQDKLYQIDLLKEIGEPARLIQRDLMYAAERGTPQKEYPHNWMRSKLPAKLNPGQVVEIPVDVACQPPDAARVDLRIAANAAEPLAIRLDGNEVPGTHKPDNGQVTVAISGKQLPAGRHVVALSTAKDPAEVSAVEIHVAIEPPPATQSAGPKASIVLAPSPNPLERFAAGELQTYLKKLFHMDAAVSATPAPEGPVFRIAATRDGLSDQGILLKPDGRTLLVAGGSPQAALWAVYELVERWGVRYLLHGDVLPERPGEMKLPETEVRIEPGLRIRQWRVVNDFACGPESWGMADYRPVLDQLAKLKFNRIIISIYPWQPFLHLEVAGQARQSATLWYNYRYPITDDMPGRKLFGNVPEFWNPDLPRNATYADFAAAGETLLHSLMAHARSRGMQSVIRAVLTEFPPEFAPLLPKTQKVHQLAEMTIVPDSSVPPDDPALGNLAAAVLRTTANTYPEADYICVDMPEFRQWADRYEQAWQSLDKKYGISQAQKLDAVLAAARQRTGYPGGADRAVQEVKGDLVALEFYDRLTRDPAVLGTTRRPDVRFVFASVAEELFPVLGRILPPGAEALNFIDYTASRVVRRREALSRLPRDVPATFICTLHDDNVGVLPQLVTGSLHQLIGDLRKHGWAGISTRYWLIGDHDPCIAYLARAAWDAAVTPDTVYRDQVSRACGPAAVPDMLEMFRELEAVTIALEDHGLGLTFPIPGMIANQMQPGPLPAELARDRDGYRKALDTARRALEKSSPSGRPYVDYWVGRLAFGTGYIDCIEAARRIATAESAGRKAEAAQHAADALRIARDMLESYARVARDQSDRGAIATMAEYVYRPLKAKAESLNPKGNP